ncbi:hypothetical protein BDW59DRAFT_89499 [Aspergillus cavernicola]|uniref:Secreted protein n=1 Tax=Aspergillus cavernicola TaxID=176166 RepID=A0ABR4I8J6_9EURO
MLLAAGFVLGRSIRSFSRVACMYTLGCIRPGVRSCFEHRFKGMLYEGYHGVYFPTPLQLSTLSFTDIRRPLFLHSLLSSYLDTTLTRAFLLSFRLFCCSEDKITSRCPVSPRGSTSGGLPILFVLSSFMFPTSFDHLWLDCPK